MQLHKKLSLINFYTFILGAFAGIGRNLPGEFLVFSGVAIIDFILIFSFLILIITKNNSVKRFIYIFRLEFLLLYVFAIFCYISMIHNSVIWDIRTSDLFEVVKYILIPFYLVIYALCFKKCPQFLLCGYILGLLVVGVLAYLNPMNPDVIGTVQIFNPNVIGNVLTFSTFFLFFILIKYSMFYLIPLFLLLMISFFTFSKAAWLMTLASVLSMYLYVMLHKISVSKKILINIAIFIPVIIIVVLNFELIYLIISSKILATDFNASASEGGSFSARLAFLKSSLIMFESDPFFGVGISNWESAHILNKSVLFEDFYLDDNPNSAYFYVLSCMGIFSFLIFIYLVYIFLKNFYLTTKQTSHLFIIPAFCILFVSGNIQLELLTAYYFWFLYALYKIEYLINENRNS